MSRTPTHQKPSGYEYWTPRPFNKIGGIIGAFTKKRTHKSERQINKVKAEDLKDE